MPTAKELIVEIYSWSFVGSVDSGRRFSVWLGHPSVSVLLFPSLAAFAVAVVVELFEFGFD